MVKIAIDWSAYDLKEKAFEQSLVEGKATLVDHPLPNGGVLRKATSEQVAQAAKQFEQRGQDLLALAEWLRAKRSFPRQLSGTLNVLLRWWSASDIGRAWQGSRKVSRVFSAAASTKRVPGPKKKALPKRG
jgi:hypothetical protein